MKTELLTATVKIQESPTTLFSTIPNSIRSIMRLEKGQELEFIAYDDRSVEIRLKKSEE
jgi:hypothetical protein